MTNKYKTIHELVHGSEDIYRGFVRPLDYELKGWDSEHQWFAEEIERLRPSVIIEVGSFLGASAIHMAKTCKRLDLDACVICVDTWLGDRQLWLRDEHRKTLAFEFGRPTVYNSFIANVLDAGMSDIILPISMHSTGAARCIKKLAISAQLIYIDGCHDIGDVFADLTLYWDLLEDGGVMLIDDYVPDTNNNEMFWGVIQDTKRFAEQHNLQIESLGRKALLRKATNV